MMPIYRCLDPYSSHGNQVPVTQQYHPSYETVSPQISFDPSKSPVPYAPCPYMDNFGYSMPCHTCSTHGNFPVYYSFRPPFPHFSSPQFSCYGHHPPFHEPFPVQHVHPSHHSMEQPRNDYYKGAPDAYNKYKNHCCGCPNHTHSPRSDEKVKVEELDQDSLAEGSNTLVPFQPRNYPYPSMWFPPEYIKNEERRRPMESEVATRERGSHHMKPPKLKPTEQEPKMWDGFFPLDVKTLRSLMKGENGKKLQNHLNKENMGQLPFPIFWMPDYNKQDEANKEDVQMKGEDGKKIQNHVNKENMRQFPFPVFWMPDYSKQDEAKKENEQVAPKSVEGMPSTVQFFPLKLNDSADSLDKPQLVQENAKDHAGADIEDKRVDKKCIPVKETKAMGEKEKHEEPERKKPEDSTTAKASKSSTDKQPSSPAKASKLPPICLRIDPLPKKGNGNRRSRSLSPPGSKEKAQVSKDTLKDVHPGPQVQVMENVHPDSQELNGSTGKNNEKKEEKEVMGVMETKTVEHKDKEGVESHSQVPVSLLVDCQKEASEQKTGNDGDKCVHEQDKGPACVRDFPAGEVSKLKEASDVVRPTAGAPKEKPKKLSDEEAALLIQSAYHGFEVRKWEPLKKLKQISEVREQLAEVRDKIHRIEESPDLQKDDKQRLVIGEMIMRLLLKLDAIQGLHPDLRDVRKSLARELVALQDKLDSLMVRKSEEVVKDKPFEDSAIACINDGAIQNKQITESSEQTVDSVSQTGNDLCPTQDLASSKSPVVVEEEQEKGIRELPSESRTDVAVVELKNEVGNSELDSGKVESAENELGGILGEQLPPMEIDSKDIEGALLQGTCRPTVNDIDREPVQVSQPAYINNVDEVKRSENLPQGLVGEDLAASSEDEEVGTGMMSVLPRGETEQNCSDLVSITVPVDDLASAENTEKILQEELPLGVIDDQEPVMREKSEIQENKVLLGGDVEHEAVFVASSPHEDISVMNEQQVNEVLPGGDVEHEVGVMRSSLDESVPILNEQQPMEAFNDGLSVDTSDDWVNVASGKEDEGPRDIPEVEGSDDEEPEENLEEDEVPQVVSRVQHEIDNGEQKEGGELGISSVDLSPSSDMESIVIGSLKKAKQNEDELDQPKGDGDVEGRSKEENEYLEAGTLDQSVKLPDQPNMSKPIEERFQVASQSTPIPVELGKGNADVEKNRKLLEENQQLKEMMEKLLEAGKEQLAVISKLTGRVSDLEKKLSSKKRRRTTRQRTSASPPPSCAKSSRNSLKKNGVVVV